jgi:hypothetical protein
MHSASVPLTSRELIMMSESCASVTSIYITPTRLFLHSNSRPTAFRTSKTCSRSDGFVTLVAFAFHARCLFTDHANFFSQVILDAINHLLHSKCRGRYNRRPSQTVPSSCIASSNYIVIFPRLPVTFPRQGRGISVKISRGEKASPEHKRNR